MEGKRVRRKTFRKLPQWMTQEAEAMASSSQSSCESCESTYPFPHLDWTCDGILHAFTATIFNPIFMEFSNDVPMLRLAAKWRSACKTTHGWFPKFSLEVPRSIHFDVGHQRCTYCYEQLSRQSRSVVLMTASTSTATTCLPRGDACVIAHMGCVHGCACLLLAYMKGKLQLLINSTERDFSTVLGEQVINAIKCTSVLHSGATAQTKKKISAVRAHLTYLEEKVFDIYDNYAEPRQKLFQDVQHQRVGWFPSQTVLPTDALYEDYNGTYLMFHHGCHELQLTTPYRGERENIWQLYKLFVVHALNYLPSRYPEHFNEAHATSYTQFCKHGDVYMRPSFLALFLMAYVSFFCFWNPYRQMPHMPEEIFGNQPDATVCAWMEQDKDAILDYIDAMPVSRTHRTMMQMLHRTVTSEPDETIIVQNAYNRQAYDPGYVSGTDVVSDEVRCYAMVQVLHLQK